MEDKRVPELRFKGFTDDWELGKLGDITTRVTRKNEKLESKLPLTISAQYGLVDQEDFFNHRVASKNISNYYLIKKGEFAYNKSYSRDYPLGAVKRLNSYNMGVLSTLYIIFKPIKIDSDFLETYYESDKWHKEVSIRATEGARNHGLLNISPIDFFDTNLVTPKEKEEQVKIGIFFKKLDFIIALHQRKLEQLELLKKAYLQQMFPKRGEVVPKLRFANFDDEWEQRKLADESKITAGGDINKSKLLESGTYPVLANALKNNGVVGYYNEIYKIEAPAVTVTGRGDIGHAKARKVNFNPVVRLLTVKSDHDVDFLENAINQLKIVVESTGVPQLTSPQLGNYKIFFPSIEEEKYLGSFFKKINDTYLLHQHKLDNIINLKQAYLQKMFI